MYKTAITLTCMAKNTNCKASTINFISLICDYVRHPYFETKLTMYVHGLQYMVLMFLVVWQTYKQRRSGVSQNRVFSLHPMYVSNNK
jgi:hypothetical protein